MNVDHINERYFGDLTDPTTERARHRVHWMCSQATGQDVMDIGCSQGIVCLILGREGFRCTGVDIEPGSLAVAEGALAQEDEIVRRRVTFQVADATDLPFEGDSFDTIILGEILEHLTHPDRILSEALRVLRDGGRIVVTVPYGLNAFHDHKRTFYPVTLLELLQPHFKTSTIDTLGDYIVYTGTKDPTYSPSALSKSELFDEYLRLECALQSRCFEKEQALLATSTRFKHLTTQLAAQATTIKQQVETLAAQDARLQTLESELQHARSESAMLREEIAAAHTDNARLRNALESTNAALAEAEQRCQILEMQNAELREELFSKDAIWQERVSRVESSQAARLRERERYFQEVLAKREADANRHVVNQRIRELVRNCVPADSRVLVVSKGDDDLLQLDGRHGFHFPQGVGGVYAGYHPRDAADAIAHLELLKAKGAQYLLIPASSLWWLDYYAEFREHLEASYSLLLYEQNTCVIYALCPSKASQSYAFGIAARNGNASTLAAESQPAETENDASPSLPAHADGLKQTDGVSLGVILDEFTAGCLQPECRLVTFRPDNWQKTLERDLPDAIFVESAWRGNDGAWLYRVANYERDMGDELTDLLDWAQRRAIPSIFWNKEDPVHFDRFIHRARLCSHVFTTDADCIPRYRELVGHDRVFALPFAAQPAIHNPILDEPRSGSVCFAGTYYGTRHPQRQEDMEYILRPAIDFGLEIYDRQHGMSGNGSENYRFPDVYQSCIQGRLDYDQMVQAYKRYRVFLNVNSVKHSPTMFARRVFELLACGTPVISTPSRGISELLGEDVVFITESEDDTRRHLEHLLGDEDAWARASVRGIRKVMREHTYRNRLREVFERVGISLPETRQPRISVLVPVDSETDLDALGRLLAAQTFRRFDVILVSQSRLSADSMQRLRNALPEPGIANIVGQLEEIWEQCREASAAEYLAFLNPRDAYGPDYLLDHALALVYSGADFVGKQTFLEADGGNQQLKNPGHEFQYVPCVQSATLVAKKNTLSKSLFEAALTSRSFQAEESRILSIDRFNYVQNAFAAGTEPGRVEHVLRRVEVHA